MNIFETAKEIMIKKEEVAKLEHSFKEGIFQQFIMERYEVKKVLTDRFNDKDTEKDLYYPIVDVPKGYQKEKETFFREYANGIWHTYILVDEKKNEIKVCEGANFKTDLDTIIVDVVQYQLTISGTNYHFTRNFSCKEMIKKVFTK